MASGTPAPPPKSPETPTFSFTVSLSCGVAARTSATSLLSPADFEADADRLSHLTVASGTPVSSRHFHGRWGGALGKAASVPLYSRLRGELLCCRRYHDLRHLATNATPELHEETGKELVSVLGRKVRTLKTFKNVHEHKEAGRKEEMEGMSNFTRLTSLT